MPSPGSSGARRLAKVPDWLPPRPEGDPPRFGRNVPLPWVVVEPGFNLRKSGFSGADLDALGQSLQTGGQIQPCLGERLPTGQILLISGHRRYEAAKRAGLKVLWVEGWDQKAPPIERYVANAVENLARRELTVPERAELFERLGKEWQAHLGDTVSAGKVDQMIAYRCAVSRQQVGQYRRFVQKLAPEVLAAWKAAPEQILVKWLDRVVQLAPEEQRKALEDRRRELAGETELGVERDGGGRHVKHRPSKRRIDHYIAMLEGSALSGFASSMSPERREGVLLGLKIAAGRAKMDAHGLVTEVRTANEKAPPVTKFQAPAAQAPEVTDLDVPEFEE